jgi:DNA-binding NarL/FixJ family response regulator
MGHTRLIAHHQAALRRTLRTLRGVLPCVDTIHEVPDRAQVVAHVPALQPDVVVLVLDGPPSLDLVRQLRAARVGGRIVARATSHAPALSAAAAAGVDVVQDTAGITDGWLSVLHRNVCGSAHDTPVDGVKR